MTQPTFDEEELASIRALEARDEEEAARFARTGDSREIRIFRPLLYLAYVWAGVVALIVYGLGSPAFALGVIGLAVLFGWFRTRRVSRFRYGPGDRLVLGAGPGATLSWSEVRELQVRYVIPWGDSRSHMRHARETLRVRFGLTNGKAIQLARGGYFEVKGGTRTAVPFKAFERWLKKAAMENGLTLEEASGTAWVARKATAS